TDPGEPREIMRVDKPETLDGYRLIWTPDGRSVLLVKSKNGTERPELWMVGVAGEKPRKLDIDLSNWATHMGFALRPDEKTLAFVTEPGKSGPEIWALENIVPKLAGKN